MRRTRNIAAGLCLIVALGGGTTSLAIGGQPAAVDMQTAPANEILIRNATVMTMTHGTIENGSVLIRNGKIADVGKDVKASPTATVVDGTGKFVTPGIIDCHSHIAIEGNVNEGSLSVTSMARIQDVIDPTDRSIFIGLSGGVTSANVLHGSANAIGGQNATIKLRWGKHADELLFVGAPPGIKFALGENPKRSNFQVQPQRYPRTRMGVEDTIRDAFLRARDYKAEWDRYNADFKAGKKNLVAPRRDLELEPLVEVLEGKRLVHSHCYRADEILMLIRISKEFGFKIATFQHVLEGYKIAKELAAEGIGASTFADFWAYKVEAFDATPYNAAVLWKAGVVVSLNSDDGERQRRLNTDAARAVRYGGVPEEEALKMITINPAKQLGIDKWTGSLDVGKDADIVVWSANPLSTYAVCEKTYVDGVLLFDRQQALKDADAAQRAAAALREKEKSSDKPKGDGPPDSKPPKIGDIDDMKTGGDQ
ncbi:MAG TPA: amidohydrolase family protein [Blastocatellia bacterium]|nr:amidohydrolase family protein [Blastocatellia bacterium]